MATLTFSPEHSALILIEYQNEWVSEHGSLRQKLIRDETTFAAAIQTSKKVLEHARRRGLNIIHVTLEPDHEYRIFGQAAFGIRSMIPVKKTWRGFQREIHADFTPLAGEHVIAERIGVSAFSGSNLNLYLRNNAINDLILIGFATHVCVESTLRAAHDLGFNTYVLTEATGAFSEAQRNYFSTHILPHFGREITLAEFSVW